MQDNRPGFQPFNRKPSFSPKRPYRPNIPLNENIRARRLRVIDHNGNNLGEISRDEALDLARAAELDLFVVSDKTDIPVARILDYGKYKFEQNKKDKGHKKTTAGSFKEIKMGYNIAIGDYNTRVEHSKKFLEKGHKVKLNITLKGREVQHVQLAKDLAQRFVDDLIEYGTSEPIPDRMVGRSIILFVNPGADKVKLKKRQQEQELREAEANAKDNTQLENP